MNLSQGGVGIKVKQALPSCGPLQVVFALPGTRRSMKMEGQLAWMDPQGNAGIRFVSTNERSKRDLQLWLEQQYFAH
jgi:hypothetical protein